MGVKGKLVSQISIKSKGDVFELFRLPNQFSKISPKIVPSVGLHSGQWGTVGSVIFWHYTINGENKVSKEVIEAIDEKNKLIASKVIDGDVLESYDSFKIIIHVDPRGEDNVVTWTMEYDKKSEAVPDPHILMDMALDLTKEIERHPLGVPN